MTLRVLVTGASGRTGRAVLERLAVEPDIEPIRFTSARSGSRSGCNIAVDLEDSVALQRAVANARPDVLVHLAAIASPVRSPEIPGADPNVQATRVLADVAVAAGAQRILFASSSAVYGDRYASPVDETGPLDPRSTYAESKLLAENVLSAVDAETVALRIFNVYGAGFDRSLVFQLRAAIETKPAVLRGLDQFVRDYVHSADVANAFVAALTAPLPERHSILNIGSGTPVSNRALVAELSRDRPLHYRVEPGEPSYSCADISRAGRSLSFVPRSMGAAFQRPPA